MRGFVKRPEKVKKKPKNERKIGVKKCDKKMKRDRMTRDRMT